MLNLSRLIKVLESYGADVYVHPVVPTHANIEVAQVRVNGSKCVVVPAYRTDAFLMELYRVDPSRHNKQVPLWGMLNESPYVIVIDGDTVYVYRMCELRTNGHYVTHREGVVSRLFHHADLASDWLTIRVADNRNLEDWLDYLRSIYMYNGPSDKSAHEQVRQGHNQ